MIRILIVNEKPLISNILTVVLEDAPDIQIVGSATSVNEVLALAPEADVILVNSQMPDDGTLEIIKEIANTEITSKIIVFGLSRLKAQALQFVQAGAAGFVLKDASVDELIDRIRDINAGRMDVSPQIASALMSRLSHYSRLLHSLQSSPLEAAQLTTRELEILEMISQGLTNQQIASHLVIGLGTVKNHVHNILHKMDVSTRREAAITWAMNNAKASHRFPSMK